MIDDQTLRLACAELAVALISATVPAAHAAGIVDLDVKPVLLAADIYAWVKAGRDA